VLGVATFYIARLYLHWQGLCNMIECFCWVRRLPRVWKHASEFCCERIHRLTNIVGHACKTLVTNLATHGMQLTGNCNCQPYSGTTDQDPANQDPLNQNSETIALRNLTVR